MSESSEVMSLTCQDNVSRSVLDIIQQSGVAGQTVSVKMVGCSRQESELMGLCTPVEEVSFFSRFFNFFSFSYTYSKSQTLKELDLVGCDDMENPDDFSRLIQMSDADAVALFSLTNKIKTFKQYIYHGHFRSSAAHKSRNSTVRHSGLNIDLSQRLIDVVEVDAFSSENMFHIEMLNMTHNNIITLPLGFFPNSTFSFTKYLDLSFNKISSLPNSIFENLTSVADLNISANRLKVLSDGIFSNNPLEVCRMSSSKMDKI